MPRLANIASILPVACLLVAGCSGGGGRKATSPTVASSGPLEVGGVERVLLYPSGENSLLTAFSVRLPEADTVEGAMGEVVERYLSGPAGRDQFLPFPPDCGLRAIFLLDASEAVVDLKGPVNEGGGSATEMARVYGLVDTLAWNFKEVKSVKLLINGMDAQTLLGHLDISRPLPPEPIMLAPSLREQVEGKAGENN